MGAADQSPEAAAGTPSTSGRVTRFSDFCYQILYKFSQIWSQNSRNLVTPGDSSSYPSHCPPILTTTSTASPTEPPLCWETWDALLRKYSFATEGVGLFLVAIVGKKSFKAQNRLRLLNT